MFNKDGTGCTLDTQQVVTIPANVISEYNAIKNSPVSYQKFVLTNSPPAGQTHWTRKGFIALLWILMVSECNLGGDEAAYCSSPGLTALRHTNRAANSVWTGAVPFVLAGLWALAEPGQSSSPPSCCFVPAHRTVLHWERAALPKTTLPPSHLPHTPYREPLLNTDAATRLQPNPTPPPPHLHSHTKMHTHTPPQELATVCVSACKHTPAQTHYHSTFFFSNTQHPSVHAWTDTHTRT